MHLLCVGRSSFHTKRNFDRPRKGKITLRQQFLLSRLALETANETITERSVKERSIVAVG